jgi:isochorismate synthase
VGLVSPEEQEYFVNLRCMQLTENGAILYAGGGITAQSDPAAEYDETVNKMKTMYRLL